MLSVQLSASEEMCVPFKGSASVYLLVVCTAGWRVRKMRIPEGPFNDFSYSLQP